MRADLVMNIRQVEGSVLHPAQSPAETMNRPGI